MDVSTNQQIIYEDINNNKNIFSQIRTPALFLFLFWFVLLHFQQQKQVRDLNEGNLSL